MRSISRSILVLATYSVLTVLLTYPVAFDPFGSVAGGIYDAWWWIWMLWLYRRAIDLHVSPFSTQLIFYPLGFSFGQVGGLNSVLSVPLQYTFGLVAAYNLLWLCSFSLSAYGMFLLSRHLTHNSIASFVAGFVFGFCPFHFGAAMGQLEIMSLQWMPFCVLYLIKAAETEDMRNIIFGAIFFSLSLLTSWYQAFYLLIFSLLLAVFMVTLHVSRRLRVLFKFAEIIGISAFFTSPFLIPTIIFSIENPGTLRPLTELIQNSPSIANFFHPDWFNTVFAKCCLYVYAKLAHGEANIFAGYTTIALALVAVRKRSSAWPVFWAATTVVFAILTLGPYLIPLPIPLPYLLLYYAKVGSIFRSPARADMIVMLSLAALVGYGVKVVLSRITSINRRYVIAALLLTIIAVEFLAVPFPTTKVAVPGIYYTISQQPDNFTILEAPIGGVGEGSLLSEQIFLFYQTVHGKEIYGGYGPRIPVSSYRYVSRYFLNMFVCCSTTPDVVSQNLSDVGISILRFYSIRYVILHKHSEYQWLDSRFKEDIPQLRKLLSVILGSDHPIYEDDKVIAYRVPDPTSKSPFLVMGDNWNPPQQFNNVWVRWMTDNSTLYVVNPTNQTQYGKLEFTVQTDGPTRTLAVYVNGELYNTTEANSHLQTLRLDGIDLRPGKTLVLFRSLNGTESLDHPIDAYSANEGPERISVAFTQILFNT